MVRLAKLAVCDNLDGFSSFLGQTLKSFRPWPAQNHELRIVENKKPLSMDLLRGEMSHR